MGSLYVIDDFIPRYLVHRNLPGAFMVYFFYSAENILFHFSFTSHNIHYITPITRHCHANNLPSTEQAVKTQTKQVFFFHFSSFLAVYLLFKCRFVA